MTGLLRKKLSKDISLLGVPSKRFWWAHLNYWLCYGTEDYKGTKTRAKRRHEKWLEENYHLSLKRNWKARLYVDATKP